VRFSKDIERMSGGKFEVKFYEPGALIPPLECFDAVSKGSIESCWTTPGYHTGKYPALAFFTTVPFGPASASSWRGSGSVVATSCEQKSTPSTISLPSTASASARRRRAGSVARSSQSKS
jgi:TRAP-type mannitol/chloroaromatic compound transport system substrate-binding protein